MLEVAKECTKIIYVCFSRNIDHNNFNNNHFLCYRKLRLNIQKRKTQVQQMSVLALHREMVSFIYINCLLSTIGPEISIILTNQNIFFKFISLYTDIALYARHAFVLEFSIMLYNEIISFFL